MYFQQLTKYTINICSKYDIKTQTQTKQRIDGVISIYLNL